MIDQVQDERAIFLAALEQPKGPLRDAFVHKACSDEPELLSRVRHLLFLHEQSQGPFDSPPLGGSVAGTIQHSRTESVGTLIGPYKLLEQIGEGGMGLVFMAEQQQPVRRLVALKLVKPGMDTKQVIARFEAERQALAMMDHPNIAKVHDAGTTETGRPYFVMELVRGIPLNEFCDQKRLTVRERLQLFIQVCQAVQHAHQKGIIHRDLKPTNVLITMDDTVPFPKVIDFGIAKALGQSLTDSTLHTGYAQLVGTPLYMSPEQAEMNLLGVDTRSDVYSLGVLLYELLTGTTPFDKEKLTKASFDEMRRMIREDDPPRPSARMSTLNAQALSTISQQRNIDPRRISATLRGELDWIVMKALEKNRNRRYESASSLAADIQRYLSDEPVLACPPTTMYRFQKFARKHKPALFTAAAIAACLILGTTVSAWQAARATTAEAQATANEAEAKAAAAAEAQQRKRAEANEEKAVANEQKANAQRDEAERQRDEIKALNEKLQRTVYAANMTLAKHAWDEAVIPRALELLDQHKPQPGATDLRGFEWHYLRRLCRPELLTLQIKSGNIQNIHTVAYSPDGKRVAASAREVKIWDAETGRELLHVKDDGECVAFSPDGKRLAVGRGVRKDNRNVGGEVKVLDALSGDELLTISGHASPVLNIAFSPDGSRLASGSGSLASVAEIDDALKVVDSYTGRQLFSLKREPVTSLAFSPDGKSLASGGWGGTLKICDARNGQELLSLRDGSWKLAYSPDGKRLARVFGDNFGDNSIGLLDPQSGRDVVVIKGGHAGYQVNGVAFSPDGKRLATGAGDRTVKLWDAETGAELATFKGHMAWSVAFSPDGSRLASGGSGEVKVWDVTSTPGIRTIAGLADNVRSMALSQDGKQLAGGTAAWDRSKSAYVGVELKILDSHTGQAVLSIKDFGEYPASVTFSPDGKQIAGGDGNTVKVWDAQTGQVLHSLAGHAARVEFVIYSPDGKRLASQSGGTSARGTVKVWDAVTARETLTFEASGAAAFRRMTFSPDGTRLAIQHGNNLVGALKVFDALTGQEIVSHQGTGVSVIYSPDGKRLASTGGGGIVVRDSQTGAELFNLKGHTAGVRSMIFSPDGKRLVSGSESPVGGGELKIWDVETGHELLTLKSGPVRGLAISPDGKQLFVHARRSVKIYDATSLPE